MGNRIKSVESTANRMASAFGVFWCHASLKAFRPGKSLMQKVTPSTFTVFFYSASQRTRANVVEHKCKHEWIIMVNVRVFHRSNGSALFMSSSFQVLFLPVDSELAEVHKTSLLSLLFLLCVCRLSCVLLAATSGVMTSFPSHRDRAEPWRIWKIRLRCVSVSKAIFKRILCENMTGGQMGRHEREVT